MKHIALISLLLATPAMAQGGMTGTLHLCPGTNYYGTDAGCAEALGWFIAHALDANIIHLPIPKCDDGREVVLRASGSYGCAKDVTEAR